VVLVVALAIAPWVVGIVLRETLEHTRALAAEAEGVRLDQELEVERAAGRERKRIARDLHDVFAASLSVMIVQAALAADLVGRDSDAAASAVLEVERSGRTALNETGRLLRLVRAGADELGMHPQHGLADIPALADTYTRAGLGIAVDLVDLARLPIGVDLATYRIVQEALTNALKHAPGSTVRVRCAQQPSAIAVEVRNGPAPQARLASVPSGHGLTGLRERVALFGGSLDARATDDGGFLLAATIPFAEPA
jgi:signal transduction histidine kinase